MTATPACQVTSHAPTDQKIWRYEPGQGLRSCRDELAGESPLEIRVRGKAVCITMRTPDTQGDIQTDRELAAGFLLSEGVIRSVSDIVEIAPCPRAREGDVINVFLAPDVQYDEAALTRHVFASSSCGICGKASIDAILSDFQPLEPPRADQDTWLDADVLATYPEQLLAEQAEFHRTGGLHAAAVFNRYGQLLAAREDVGRHNAVDKVLGHLLLSDRFPLSEHVLLVSGRVSFEIMQKALAAQIPIVAAVSAPSSLAVDFAEDSGQTLIGFLRNQSMNVYAHPQRLRG